MIRNILETIHFGLVICFMYVLPNFKVFVHIFRNQMLQFGIAAIKICQYIFPFIKNKYPERKLLIAVLETLGNDCRKYSIDTQKIIRQEGLSNIIETMDDFPVHSGSIAQVFVGYDENGRKFAVKVKHDYIEKQLVDVRHFIKTLRYLFAVNVDYNDFYHFLHSQTNLKNEYENLKYFHDNNPERQKIIIPKPFYATERVLVMEWVDFESFPSIVNRLPAKELSMYNYFLLLFYDASILLFKKEHCDLHHGNWGVNLEEKKIVIIDFGIVVDLHSKFIKCHIACKRVDDVHQRSKFMVQLLSDIFHCNMAYADLTSSKEINRCIAEIIRRSKDMVVTTEVFLLFSRSAFFGCINDEEILRVTKKQMYLFLTKNKIFPELKKFYKELIFGSEEELSLEQRLGL